MIASEDMYADLAQYKIELTREITKEKYEEKVEGVAGPFKKLNVDWVDWSRQTTMIVLFLLNLNWEGTCIYALVNHGKS